MNVFKGIKLLIKGDEPLIKGGYYRSFWWKRLPAREGFWKIIPRRTHVWAWRREFG